MKRAFLLLSLGAFLSCPAFAQSMATTNAPAATPPGGRTPGAPGSGRAPAAPPLTKEESQELNQAYAGALKANPDFVTQQKDLKDKMKALQDQMKPLQDQMKELQGQGKDLQQKINEAEIQADPNVAPILAAHPQAHASMPPPPKAPKAPKPTAPAKTATPSTNAAPTDASAPSTNAAPTTPKPAGD